VTPRRSHASVYASSSCRPFELASAGAAIVSNPYNGIERWFEPGSELVIVEDAEQATEAYRDLLAWALGHRRLVVSPSTSAPQPMTADTPDSPNSDFPAAPIGCRSAW